MAKINQKKPPIIWDNTIKKNNILQELIKNEDKSKDYNQGLNKVMTNMEELSQQFLPQLDSYLGIKATSIPFMTNLVGYFITNPSTVSVDTFRRIAMVDPTLTASINYHSDVVTSMISKPTHTNPEIQKFLTKVYNEMEKPLKYYFKDLYGQAYISGCSVQVIYDTQEKGYYQITDLLPLPSETLVFAVEADGRLHRKFGYNQYVLNTFGNQLQNSNYYGMNFIGTTGTTANSDNLPDPFALQGDMPFPIRSPLINLFGLVNIPKDDVFHFTFSDCFSVRNPYGISKLRCLYSLIVLKYGVLQFLSEVLAQKSFPLLVVKYDGTIETQSSDGQSQPLQVSIEEALASMRELGAMAIPTIDGVDVEAIKTEGDLDVFIKILEVIESWLFLGNGTPPTLGNSAHGQVQHSGGSYLQDTIHNKIVTSQRNDIIDMWCKTIQRKLIENNFNEGVDYDEGDWGSFEVLATSIDDRMKLVKIFQEGITSGIISNTSEKDILQMKEILLFDTSEESIIHAVKENKKLQDAELKKQNERGTNFREAKDNAKQPYAHHQR